MQVACQAVESEGPAGVRLSLQWRLALALRREYFDLVARRYPGEYRLDPSYLPLAAMRSLTVAGAWMPTLLVVDDVQDLTLGGLALLAVLQGLGVHLVLFGDPDEAVQAFRGSYPEYLYARFLDPNGPFAADHVSLQAFQHEPATYRDIVASRVSLSIASAEESSLPLAQRPGKLPAVEGSDRLRPLDANDPHTKKVLEDGSLNGRLYRSANDELDNIVWQISALHLNDRNVTWNDMAVICHDNADVLRFGERLRGADVPVRYSSVTRPLADEPFVQGLFALIELAQLRAHGLETRSMTLAAAAQYVRARVGRIAESLLIDTANMGTNTINAAHAPEHGECRAFIARSVGEDLPDRHSRRCECDGRPGSERARRIGEGIRFIGSAFAMGCPCEHGARRACRTGAGQWHRRGRFAAERHRQGGRRP